MDPTDAYCAIRGCDRAQVGCGFERGDAHVLHMRYVLKTVDSAGWVTGRAGDSAPAVSDLTPRYAAVKGRASVSQLIFIWRREGACSEHQRTIIGSHMLVVLVVRVCKRVCRRHDMERLCEFMGAIMEMQTSQ